MGEQVTERAPSSRRTIWIRSLGKPGLFPLAVLFGLNFVDEFERYAFSTLAPEIRADFGLSEADFIRVATLAAATALFVGIPVGFLGDRFRRTRLCVLAAMVWIAGAVTTAITDLVLILAIARFAAGSGRLVNDTVHPSLISDYYPLRVQTSVNAVHRIANHVGALVAGPLAGLLAVQIGNWRPVFFLVSIPTVIMVLFALRLGEPGRGSSWGFSAEGHLSFSRAFRRVWSVKTIRRICLPAFLVGATFFPFANIIGLFFASKHGMNPAARGWVLAAYGIGGMLGLLTASRLSAPAYSGQRLGRLLRVASALAIVFAAGKVLMAVSPWPSLAVAGVVIAGAGVFGITPPYLATVAAVSHPLVRTQTLTYAIVVYGFGGVVSSQLIGYVAARAGLTGAILALAVLSLLGGLSALPAARSVDQDSSSLEKELGAQREA